MSTRVKIITAEHAELHRAAHALESRINTWGANNPGVTIVRADTTHTIVQRDGLVHNLVVTIIYQKEG